jgi:hypothetical protein
LLNSFKIHCSTMWYFLLDFETVWQCGIFCWILKLFENVVFFVGFWNCLTVWNFLLDFETVQQCDIFCWILKLKYLIVEQFQNLIKNTTLSNSFKIQQKIPHCWTVSKSNNLKLFDNVVFFIRFWNCSTMWYFLLYFVVFFVFYFIVCPNLRYKNKRSTVVWIIVGTLLF